ncbi:MAG: heavy metal translocating P-type ATPase, partial [Clostridia bacterium]|nr:heavy metal translocating P-type ATPase [Clostridia bacterium]
MRITYHLKGLDCPNCAAKIEKEAGAIAGVTHSEMNLMQQELTVEAESDVGLLEKVTKIVHSHEPDVKVSAASGEHRSHGHKDECGCGHCGHDHDHEHDHDHDDDDDDHDHDHGDNDGESFRPRVIRIAAGAAVYLCGVILGERFGILPHILIIAAAYVILGYDVVIRALRNLFRGRVFDENFLMTLSTVCAFLIGSTTEAA